MYLESKHEETLVVFWFCSELGLDMRIMILVLQYDVCILYSITGSDYLYQGTSTVPGTQYNTPNTCMYGCCMHMSLRTLRVLLPFTEFYYWYCNLYSRYKYLHNTWYYSTSTLLPPKTIICVTSTCYLVICNICIRDGNL